MAGEGDTTRGPQGAAQGKGEGQGEGKERGKWGVSGEEEEEKKVKRVRLDPNWILIGFSPTGLAAAFLVLTPLRTLFWAPSRHTGVT